MRWVAAPKRPSAALWRVTAQNSGMVTAQVTMHHGQSVPSTKTLWLMNQTTNASAPSTATLKVIQNHRARLTPTNTRHPTVTMAAQETNPTNGLGKPRTEPCQDSRFVPHWTSRLTLQFSSVLGSRDTSTLSTASA